LVSVVGPALAATIDINSATARYLSADLPAPTAENAPTHRKMNAAIIEVAKGIDLSSGKYKDADIATVQTFLSGTMKTLENGDRVDKPSDLRTSLEIFADPTIKAKIASGELKIPRGGEELVSRYYGTQLKGAIDKQLSKTIAGKSASSLFKPVLTGSTVKYVPTAEMSALNLDPNSADAGYVRQTQRELDSAAKSVTTMIRAMTTMSGKQDDYRAMFETVFPYETAPDEPLSYTPGLIQHGYRFLGGDPTQQQNWETV
jgi:hypothetical protein